MNRFTTLVLVLVLCSAPTWAAVTLVTSAQALANTGAADSASVDTTGATLLVCVVSNVVNAMTAVTDSKTNTWTPLTERVTGATRERIYYVANPTVGTSHTFHASASWNSVFCAAFAGVATTTPFDTENGGTTASGTTVACGAITPNAAGELLVAGLGVSGGGTTTIDTSYTVLQQYTASSFSAGGIAWRTAPNTSSINPTWTILFSSALAAGHASFKEPAATARRRGIQVIQ